jgi:hypothetical protein
VTLSKAPDYSIAAPVVNATFKAQVVLCVRRGNLAQHRRWMIRSYPFAMIFTVARVIIPIPPVYRLGSTGVEIVVWTTIALAAFLPNIFLEWQSISHRVAPKAATNIAASASVRLSVAE